MQLVKAEYGDKKTDITSSLQPLADLDAGNVYGDSGYELSGWNLGNLPRGEYVTLTIKAKVDPEKVTSAVDAAKTAKPDTDAADARQVSNKAFAIADRMVNEDGTPAVVSDSAIAYVRDTIGVSKSAAGFDPATQTEYYRITVSAGSANRYTLHDVPIEDYFFGLRYLCC